MSSNLKETFGNIDIYLFDQLLKGRFDNCRSIIDVGCGTGRNLVYFLKNNFEVYGVDQNPESIEAVRRLSLQLAPGNAPENFRLAQVDNIPFGDASFDISVCNAVLHFAKNAEHFDSMLRSAWRVLKPGGFFFARLASDIGIEQLVRHIGNGRFLLPDGTERFLVNEQVLLDYTGKLQGELYEPIKTTNVQNLRCMTTWCMRKRG